MKKPEYDGGYYAIKGFVYQFDKTLLEILGNPAITIEIEHIQDLSLNDFYIQVKHKESQTFSPSKIKTATMQLIEAFKKDPTKKFCLYCHFKEETMRKWELTESELNEILGADQDKYRSAEKISFLKNFHIQFSEDFEKQFKNLIQSIKGVYSLKQDEEAINYHAILQNCLIKIAIRKNPKERKINKEQVDGFIKKCEKVIFHSAYLKHAKKESYLKFLKKEYFNHKHLNIEGFERLFIIECEESGNISDLVSLIAALGEKYCHLDNSPAPYICLANYKILTALKQKLWDKEIRFVDGTHFDGDKFRIDSLTYSTHKHNNPIKIKLFDDSKLIPLLKRIRFDRVYNFFITEPYSVKSKTPDKLTQIYMPQTGDIIKLIQ